MTAKVQLKKRPFMLIIRDGWGYNPNAEDDKYNAIKLAKTPCDDMLMSQYPHTLIHTYGEDVGLPEGTMGNSEVGHQNIGAGRIVYQDSVRITKSIREGDFFENEQLCAAVDKAKASGGKLHLMGLCSDIGVHSLLKHLYGLLELARRKDMKEVYLHAFTDGRDSPPRSGKGYLEDIEKKMAEIGCGQIASISGRFYAMDRDNRWERVQKAYECLTGGIGGKAANAAEAMDATYAEDETDEFVKPTNIVDDNGNPKALIENGDSVIFFNFRGDRPREITRAFVDPDFKGFERKANPEIYFVCMTQYDKSIPAAAAYLKPPKMKNIFGEYLGDLGLTEFRCAETEKYAHVTFFFNDYREEPFPGEDRQIVASPKVETYDLEPQMSAYGVTDVLIEKLNSQKYDVFVVNYANPDMVGHTGVLDAAVKACEIVDECVGKLVDKVRELGGAALITADHGNCEKMAEGNADNPFTSHTTGDVPMIIFDEDMKSCKLREGGNLADIVPTLLEMMGLEKPSEMTGTSLIIR
jgi:2,3-bisphosphoglycerate-independent phosphoglycerate mutase